jgi:hypothetical protein
VQRLLEAGLVVCVVAAGLTIRLAYLDAQPFWVDEAESSINALTILEKGYPSDTYLGQPIYENTLVQPWPESAEYEFRDVSYSDRGFAVYHGWLPLYLIAGSFKLYGVQPDQPGPSRTVRHDLAERKRRTRAARLPGALFGAVFLCIAFAGGRILYGRDAAWAALLVGCIYPWHLFLSRQARYYSPQIALTTACCVLLWLLLRDCRWRHVWLSALVFVLLFHTHLLSFCVGAAVAALIAPLIVWRHPFAVRKLAALAGVIAIGTLPWVLVTGFLRHQERIPRAWSLLRLPADILRFPPLHLPYLVCGVAALTATAWIAFGGKRLPGRIYAPFAALAPVVAFLAAWGLCAYALFLGFIPAASFSISRLNYSYWGPTFLLAAIVCTALARVAAPRYSTVAAPAIMLLLFFATGHRLDLQASINPHRWDEESTILRQIDAMHLDSASRLYSAPNSHLILSFYSGLPVQNIAPVRKSFLDSYPGEIVFIDTPVIAGALPVERIRTEALRHGITLSPETAERWRVLLQSRRYREATLASIDGEGAAPLEAVPECFRKLLVEDGAGFAAGDMELITRNFEVRTWQDWRTVFEYRFVDPESRGGPRANYAERLRGSRVLLLSSGFAALYRSPRHPPGAQQPVRFEFVP